MVFILSAALGLACGYIAAVLLYLGLTLFLTAASPHLVSDEGHFRPLYLVITSLFWLLATTAAGYLSTWLIPGNAATLSARVAIALLALLLAIAAWRHPLEARRQLLGLIRPFMAAFSLAGVALGCYLRIRH